jgi:predicted GNAT family acetyltransferase
MDIKHEQSGQKGSFYIEIDNSRKGMMTYRMAGDKKMIIDHTEVGDELRGKNAGYQMVNAAVDYARANGIKILPLCPFANSVFKKKTELQDVLLNQP